MSGRGGEGRNSRRRAWRTLRAADWTLEQRWRFSRLARGKRDGNPTQQRLLLVLVMKVVVLVALVLVLLLLLLLLLAAALVPQCWSEFMRSAAATCRRRRDLHRSLRLVPAAAVRPRRRNVVLLLRRLPSSGDWRREEVRKPGLLIRYTYISSSNTNVP